MSNILETIVRRKHEEIAAANSKVSFEQLESLVPKAPAIRSFLAAISGAPPIRLIAEVKKASPSRGVIREDFDPVAIAECYQRAGASCVSVLTDVDFFQGSLEYLKQVRQSVDLPILRKDFVIDPYQVYEARVAGADAVLLIAECLEHDQMKSLHKLICELGMTALVELHDEENLDNVLSLNPELVGINNRDLRTFETNLQHTIDLRNRIPPQVLVVGESGIFTREHVVMLQSNKIDAMLVGESLMRNDDIEAAAKALLDDG